MPNKRFGQCSHPWFYFCLDTSRDGGIGCGGFKEKDDDEDDGSRMRKMATMMYRLTHLISNEYNFAFIPGELFDLVAPEVNCFERGQVGDVINEEKSFCASEVGGSDRSIMLLASRIPQLGRINK